MSDMTEDTRYEGDGVETPAHEDSGASGRKGSVEDLEGLGAGANGKTGTGSAKGSENAVGSAGTAEVTAHENSGTAETTTTDGGQKAVGGAGDFRGYDEQMRLLREAADRYKPETEEERKKRERKERSKRIAAAVGDGLMALSNLFMTTRGAPNMYKHETMSQQKALQTQLDKLKAEREANADKYLQYALKIGDLQNDRAKTVRELEQKQEEARLKRAKDNREAEEHGWAAALQPSKVKEQNSKAAKAAEEAVTAKAEADNAVEYYKARAGAEKRRNTKTAKTTNKPPEYVAYDENGNPHSFRTKAAADYFARQHGTYKESESTSTNSYGETTVTKRRGGYPAKPAQKPAQKPTQKQGFASGLKF